MYQCRHLRWAGEQKNMSLHTLGPNVKKKDPGNEQKKDMVGNSSKKYGRGRPRVPFFSFPVQGPKAKIPKDQNYQS